MSTPVVSVVIVNYNAGDYLERCLQTLDAQTFRDFEVIIIDNASKDNSLALINPDRPVQIVRNIHNKGFAAAQNQGFALGTGRYLLPLNFDIALEPNFLACMLEVMEANPRAGSGTGKLRKMSPAWEKSLFLDNAGLLLGKKRFPIHRGAGQQDQGQYDQLAYVFGAMGAAAFYRREMLEDIAYQGQYFDESYFMWYEDIDLDWRGRLRGWTCIYTPNAVAYHVRDPHGHNVSPFGAETSMRNRWMMLLSDECGHCLLKNSPWLLKEEFGLLKHAFRHGLLRTYFRALRSFIRHFRSTLQKRTWIRSRAVVKCLPDYPAVV